MRSTPVTVNWNLPSRTGVPIAAIAGSAGGGGGSAVVSAGGAEDSAGADR